MSRNLSRIILHWTGGSDSNQDDDVRHYHFIVTRSGKRVVGVYTPEDNILVADDVYAAHTRKCNTGSIGMALDGMRGAVERPFNAGPEPITEVQLRAFVKWVAEVAKRYSIPVTRTTILTHAEVQPTLGIAQNGKWDIRWLPGMDKPLGAVLVGDRIRGMIQAELDKL
jgi:N-acetyl-anhydromuramyl-L-alanine amidase AmpD